MSSDIFSASWIHIIKAYDCTPVERSVTTDFADYTFTPVTASWYIDLNPTRPTQPSFPSQAENGHEL